MQGLDRPSFSLYSMFKVEDYWIMFSYNDFEPRDYRSGARWKVFALMIDTKGVDCILKGNGACYSMRACVRNLSDMTDEQVKKVGDKLAQQWAGKKYNIVRHYRNLQSENEFGRLNNCFNTAPTKPSKSKSEKIKEEAVRIINSHSEEDALAIARRIQGFCNGCNG